MFLGESIRRFIAVLIIAGLLHLVWEYAHQPLYTGYEALGSGWTLALWATAGDVMYTLLMLLILSAWRRGFGWIMRARSADYSALALLSAGVALGVEYKALHLQRWGYAESMPLVPVLGVGVSPVLQMIVITVCVVWLVQQLTPISKRV